MARRGRKASANKASSPPSRPPQEEHAKESLEVGGPLERVKRFERPLPKNTDGLTSSGDVILAREIKPQDNYPQYLRERAISALIELERMAYKNFEDAISLATAAVQATDAILQIPSHEVPPPNRPSSAAPPVIEELSTSSEGTGDFEGFLQELLRLLSIDLSRDPTGCQQLQQQQALQRLDLLQRLASTEPKDIKEALTTRDRDTSGALHLSLLERFSSGESSEALHLSLLEKLSFSDGQPPKEEAPAGSAARGSNKAATEGDKKRMGAPLSIRQQLDQQEQASENLHLSLLERIGSLADIPAGTGASDEGLHLSILFGRGISQEDADRGGRSSVAAGVSSAKPAEEGKAKRPPAAKDTSGIQVGTKPRNATKAPLVNSPRGGVAARQQYRGRASGAPGSSSSCSGSTESCRMALEATCGFRDTETEQRVPEKALQKAPRGHKGAGVCGGTESLAAVRQLQQQQQPSRAQQQPLTPSSNLSVLRSTSPVPGSQRTSVQSPAPAPTGENIRLEAPTAATGAPPLLTATAGGERRPASATPQSVMSPEAFWDLFYAKTSRKMLADSAAKGLTAPSSAAPPPRPATPSPGAIKGSPGPRQGGQRQTGAWVWIDSESSLDIPCPGGCGSRCEETPEDAETSGLFSSNSSEPSAPLALRGIALQQQQQVQQQQQPARVCVAGPVEANGRPPLLLQGPIPMVPATALPTSPPEATEIAAVRKQPQHTDALLGAFTAQQMSPRRKHRGRRRRSSARRRR